MAANWDELERWMEGQRLPKGFDILKEPDWVEQFVRKMMTKTLPEAAGLITGSGGASISQSKLAVTVQIKLPDGCRRDRLRLHIREDKLRVSGLPGSKDRIIKLPCLVKPRVCQAAVRDGTLHIKLRKRQGNRTYYEHGIYWR